MVEVGSIVSVELDSSFSSYSLVVWFCAGLISSEPFHSRAGNLLSKQGVNEIIRLACGKTDHHHHHPQIAMSNIANTEHGTEQVLQKRFLKKINICIYETMKKNICIFMCG